MSRSRIQRRCGLDPKPTRSDPLASWIARACAPLRRISETTLSPRSVQLRRWFRSAAQLRTLNAATVSRSCGAAAHGEVIGAWIHFAGLAVLEPSRR